MQIKLDFNKSNYKIESDKYLLLGNSNHLRILILLKENGRPMNTKEIIRILEQEGIYKHRENVHKALQKLVMAGFIIKEKGKNKIGDIYSI